MNDNHKKRTAEESDEASTRHQHHPIAVTPERKKLKSSSIDAASSSSQDVMRTHQEPNVPVENSLLGGRNGGMPARELFKEKRRRLTSEGPSKTYAAATVQERATNCSPDMGDRIDKKPAAETEKQGGAWAPETAKRTETESTPEEAGNVTGDSVMGFNRFPQLTNRQLMNEQYGFVCWARNQSSRNRNLESFVQWSYSAEAKQLEREAQGNEVFSFGQHRGKKFREIRLSDPDYHLRYGRALEAHNQEMPAVLSRYIDWLSSVPPAEGSVAPLARASVPPTRASAAQPRRTYYSSDCGTGNKQFPFGQHKGRTFREVAQVDPSYHLRFKKMDPRPNPVLDDYITWFDAHSPTRFSAGAALDDYLHPRWRGVDPYDSDLNENWNHHSRGSLWGDYYVWDPSDYGYDEDYD